MLRYHRRMDSPLFSIVILVPGSDHLLPLTLDTIRSQTEKRFEVLLVGKGPVDPLRKISSSYESFPIRVLSVQGDLSMMNEGAIAATGKYLQFLYPGDRFLSQGGLAYLQELMADSHLPDLVYSGFLMRSPEGSPHAVSFPLNRKNLQKGMFPIMPCSSWFLKESLMELGGFDDRFRYRSPFDLLCRLYQKKGVRVVYSRRVLTDSEPHRTRPREMAGYAADTCRILYRHFGLWHAMRWIFVQDHLNVLRWTAYLIRQAFLQHD